MEPFFSGMAIGLVLLFVLGIPAILLLLVACFFYGFFKAAHTSWVKAHPKRPHTEPH